MHTAGRVILLVAGFLIAAGGLYDLLTPRLPANLAAICADSEAAPKLVRELLRALGGALVAIGAAVVLLVIWRGPALTRFDLALILVLVLPAEGVNAMAMRRVRSPWQIPAAFVVLTLSGAILVMLR
jgi:hypothetical protein